MEEKKKRVNKKWIGLRVRCSPEDRAEIERYARQAGMSLSQYVRDYSLIPRTSPKLPVEVTKAISGFARNLNQLTYHANSTGTAGEVQAIEGLKREATRIIAAVEQVRK